MNYKAQSAQRNEPRRSRKNTAQRPQILIWVVIAIVFITCDNRIIERAANDYFPIETGNWWSYSNDNIYEPKQVYVEVESLTSVMSTDCYPVTYSGVVRYIARDDRAVREYRELVYDFEGDDYIVVHGFLTRIRLPMVQGSAYADSVIDSVNIGGVFVHGKCRIDGLVSEYADNGLYGNVYKVIVSTRETIVAPDTTIASTSSVEEYYAPGIGLVRFIDDEGEFHLSDYKLY
jgi:hypothetical protein